MHERDRALKGNSCEQQDSDFLSIPFGFLFLEYAEEEADFNKVLPNQGRLYHRIQILVLWYIYTYRGCGCG